MEFIPEMKGHFNIWKSVAVIHHVNWLSRKSYDYLKNEEKLCDKIQYLFMMKTANKLGIWKFIHICMCVCEYNQSRQTLHKNQMDHERKTEKP